MVQFDPEIGRGPGPDWLMDFIAERAGGEVVWQSMFTDGLVAVYFARGDAEEGEQMLRNHWPYVHKADRTVRGRPGGMLSRARRETTPNDPNFGDQWGLQLIRAPEAWDIRTDGSGKIVAVVDSGVFWPHPDLVDNMRFENGQIKGAAFMLPELEAFCNAPATLPAGDDPLEYGSAGYEHGTPVASIIGARSNNGIGVAGVAWTAPIMPVRFGEPSGVATYCSGGYCSADDVVSAIAALEYAMANGARIINLSHGWTDDPADAFYSALKNAETFDVLVVVCANNQGEDLGGSNPSVRRYPPVYSTVIDTLLVVGAVNADDELRSFSNYSTTYVQIAAPGGDIRVVGAAEFTRSIPDPPYSEIVYYCPPTEYFGGTSSAAPFVSGAAALVWSEYPNLTAVQVKERILNGARFVQGLENHIQGGRVLDLVGALEP